MNVCQDCGRRDIYLPTREDIARECSVLREVASEDPPIIGHEAHTGRRVSLPPPAIIQAITNLSVHGLDQRSIAKELGVGTTIVRHVVEGEFFLDHGPATHSEIKERAKARLKGKSRPEWTGILAEPVQILMLAERISNQLQNREIMTIGDLLSTPQSVLFSIGGFSDWAWRQIVDGLFRVKVIDKIQHAALSAQTGSRWKSNGVAPNGKHTAGATNDAVIPRRSNRSRAATPKRNTHVRGHRSRVLARGNSRNGSAR